MEVMHGMVVQYANISWKQDKDGQRSWAWGWWVIKWLGHKCGVDDANDTFGADKQGDKEGTEVLELLEGVDDDMDRLGVGMVKISEPSAAKYEDEYEDDVDRLADLCSWIQIQGIALLLWD